MGSVVLAIVLLAPTATQSDGLGQEIAKNGFCPSSESCRAVQVAAPAGPGQATKTERAPSAEIKRTPIRPRRRP